jgi:hypothetical protein
VIVNGISGMPINASSARPRLLTSAVASSEPSSAETRIEPSTSASRQPDVTSVCASGT